MRARPILFSAPMVRAILREIEQPGAGKTQARRVLSNGRPNSLFNGQWADSYVLDPGNQSWRDDETRYAVGDRLYVREAWRCGAVHDYRPPRELRPGGFIAYEADAPHELSPLHGRFRQGMHMPRWASRITLIVEDVRVQRVQEISEADAIAEGIEQKTICGVGKVWKHYGNPDAPVGWQIATQSFQSLWDSLNAERAPWESNPWIAAYTFRPILGNIDQIDRRPA